MTSTRLLGTLQCSKVQKSKGALLNWGIKHEAEDSVIQIWCQVRALRTGSVQLKPLDKHKSINEPVKISEPPSLLVPPLPPTVGPNSILLSNSVLCLFAAGDSVIPRITLNVDKENGPILSFWLKTVAVISGLNLAWALFCVAMRFIGPIIAPPRPAVPQTTEYLPGFEPDNLAGDLQMSDADFDRRLERAVERVLERR